MTWRSSREAARTLLCWALSLTAAVAQQTVDVRMPSAKLLDASPGQIVTASVVVANRGAEEQDFNERLTLPEGCVKVAPADLPFSLAAGAQTVRLLAIQIPTTMAAGRFSFTYAVQGRRDPSATASIELDVRVAAIDGLELIIDPRTDPILAGDNYAIRGRVTNRGNSPVPLRLTWRSSLDYRVSSSVSSFTLAAGASQEILCRVATDKNLARRASHAVTFDISGTSTSGKILSASRASVVELIPLMSGNRDPFHYLPMQLKLTALADSSYGLQFQAELAGAGSLDEAGKHRVDFIFRGPDIQNTNFFGEHDEYGLSYHGEKWDVQLGDRIYELSPLTERRGFGRGAGFSFRSGATSTGAFYMTTLRRQKNTEELGAFIRHEVSHGFSFQGNFLRKWGGDDPTRNALPQNIATLETHLRHGRAIDLRVEAGVSRSDSGKTDYAVRAEARGQLFGRLDYAVEHTYAGPNFHGYDSDTRNTYASAVLPLTDQWRAHASLSIYSGNLDLNPERSTVVNRENSWDAGLSYKPDARTDLSLDWRHVSRNDVLEPAAYDFTEDSARLGVGRNFGRIQMQSFLDLGTLDNRVTGESGPFQRYSTYLTWQPTPRQGYSIFGVYGPSASTGSMEKSLNAGVSANWQVRDNLSTNVSYARNQYDNLDGSEQDQAMASLRYRCPNKDEIAIIGRWNHRASQKENESAVMVTFTRPLSVAVSRKTSIGSLRGRLTESGTGIARAVITAGEDFAVTDSTGEFEFPALKPGACELRVLNDSLSPALVISTPLPMKVRVRSAQTTRVELQAVKAATVSVRLAVFAPASAGTFKETGGLEAGVVELVRGSDVLPAQTDRLGNITFDRVPCGPWTLRVRDTRLPERHFVEQPEQSFVLQSGEAKKIEVRILPRKRTIQMIDQGSIR